MGRHDVRIWSTLKFNPWRPELPNYRGHVIFAKTWSKPASENGQRKFSWKTSELRRLTTTTSHHITSHLPTSHHMAPQIKWGSRPTQTSAKSTDIIYWKRSKDPTNMCHYRLYMLQRIIIRMKMWSESWCAISAMSCPSAMAREWKCQVLPPLQIAEYINSIKTKQENFELKLEQSNPWVPHVFGWKSAAPNSGQRHSDRSVRESCKQWSAAIRPGTSLAAPVRGTYFWKLQKEWRRNQHTWHGKENESNRINMTLAHCRIIWPGLCVAGHPSSMRAQQHLLPAGSQCKYAVKHQGTPCTSTGWQVDLSWFIYAYVESWHAGCPGTAQPTQPSEEATTTEAVIAAPRSAPDALSRTPWEDTATWRLVLAQRHVRSWQVSSYDRPILSWIMVTS